MKLAQRDHSRLLADLEKEYVQRFPKCGALHTKGKEYLVSGGSHALRLMEPFPLRIVSAKGAWYKDEDGHDILDFWQGHLANILGFNPDVITSALSRGFADGFGLQVGIPDRLQIETAEILCQLTGAERARFTTSGTLATMYAILLSRVFSGRDLVMKVGGGWHGAHAWGLMGVNYDAGGGGYGQMESEGLPPAFIDDIVVTRFNDLDMLHDHFKQYGDQLACFILEPVIGAKGCLPATRDYIQNARELTQRYGVVLILDEVITGFRFRAGDAGALYGVKPDLATFGKAVGGGMPVAAVVGRADIMNLAGPEGGRRVAFSGGTYSAHPASLLAAKTSMMYLRENEDEIYPYLAAVGEKTRQIMEEAFTQEDIHCLCTGNDADTVKGSSLFMVHFPYDADADLTSPDALNDPSVCDVVLNTNVLQLALLLEGVYLSRGHGVLTTAHTEEDVNTFGEACRKAAKRIKAYL